MSGMSYIHILERYHDHRGAITDLLTSLLTGLAEDGAGSDPATLHAAVNRAAEHYPFLDMAYTLDSAGRQASDNLAPPSKALPRSGAGADRSQRPYFRAVREAGETVVTAPYLSSASRHLCLSAAMPLEGADGEPRGYLVLDADLAGIVAFLLGDGTRRRFQPLFKAIYLLIVAGLLAVVGLLLFFSFQELRGLFTGSGQRTEAAHLKPFGVIIFLTLSLAIFDLAKTILEEEVLTHKDIFRHSSTRRTITRFIAAILIAVSIESLLLMFKAALGTGQSVLPAVAMMLAVVGLLVGLGLYVYLGSRAEVALLAWHKEQRNETGRP